MNSPKIVELQPKPHVPWGFDETLLKVGAGEDIVEIDLAERQGDSEAVIDICRCASGLMEGACGSYVLSVEIPPRRYREETGDTQDMSGSEEVTGTIFVPEPLDMASVTIRLWTDEAEAEETNEEEI
jgi:hypothetical protein